MPMKDLSNRISKCHKCGKEHLEFMDYVPDYSTGKLVVWCSKCWKQHYIDEDNVRTQKLIDLTRNFNKSLKEQGLI